MKACIATRRHQRLRHCGHVAVNHCATAAAPQPHFRATSASYMLATHLTHNKANYRALSRCSAWPHLRAWPHCCSPTLHCAPPRHHALFHRCALPRQHHPAHHHALPHCRSVSLPSSDPPPPLSDFTLCSTTPSCSDPSPDMLFPATIIQPATVHYPTATLPHHLYLVHHHIMSCCPAAVITSTTLLGPTDTLC